MKGKKKNIKLLTKGKQWNSLVLDTLFEVIKISIKRQGQRLLGRRFHSIFYGWRQTSTEAQQMQNANGKEERKKNKHLFQTPSHEGLGKAEPVLRKSKALLNPAGNKKQPKRKQWQAQWGCCLCSRYELLECQHSDTQPEWWQPHVTTAQLFPCRKAKFHCLPEQPSAPSGSGTATQVPNSEESSPLPFRESLSCADNDKVCTSVPAQSQARGRAPLPAVATNVTWNKKKGKKKGHS